MRKIEVKEFAERLKDGEQTTIIDSRSATAWDASDIKAAGAIRIPPDEAEKHISDVSRDDFSVVYCT
ncbi:MAG TPA: rhodanese-like domain-containing protein [Pyrinomonadaceae bacterium]|jgi:rhodanese-related sulfurtransferase|nr:rhodanese-like domain-containing protein [Pyrinomonadaceae bacterium]